MRHLARLIVDPLHASARDQYLPMVWRVENAFAQLGRWRRLSHCFEGSAESAKAWLEVACVGYMLGRV
jgi:transposase